MNFNFKNQTREKIDVALRDARYHYIGINPKDNKVEFTRPFGQNPYPRFHLFLKTKDEVNINASLHLDQIKPRFEGTTAHNADYDSELITNEAKRIQDFFEMSKASRDKDF